MRKELLKGLTEEQIAKLRGCKNSKEVLELAKAEGIELNEEQLAAVSGGACVEPPKCPICGSENVDWQEQSAYDECHCKNCGHDWRN